MRRLGRSVGAPLFEKNNPMPGNRPHQHEAGRPRWIQKPLSASSRADFPVVAIGASAGGLDACKKLLDALPAGNGMAFILVQHLDPSHDSMMVGLLAGHTSMPVSQATDGMAIERERVYVIPPGVYLSVDKGALRISRPQERHGARLPFDFLLNSLAREYGARAVCVILSGTGADGSVGLTAVKAKGGLVIAQELGEADYDGMPQSAIATGEVDLVLPAAKIAEALVSHEQGAALAPTPRKSRLAQIRRRLCCQKSSISCGRKRFTISPITSTARSNAASSGGWRWRQSRPRRSIWISCFATPTNAISSPGIC